MKNKKLLFNIIKFCSAREVLSNLFYDFAKIASETRTPKQTPKQTLQRLTIALAQVKAGNTSETLLKEIRQIVFREKEIT